MNPGSGYSVNLFKNFYREISQLIHDILQKNSDIQEVKQTNSFFTYKETMIEFEVIKEELDSI